MIRLKYLCSFHGRAVHILAELAEVLTNHYAALAAKGGTTFAELVKNAYNSPRSVDDRGPGLRVGI